MPCQTLDLHDDDAQEAQRLLQHQHRDRQRRALEGVEDKQEGCNSVNKRTERERQL